MFQFYVCPIILQRTPWGTISPAGKVYVHRARGERYTLHRGLGQAVLCSLEEPAIETAANIAGDQECVEWPDLGALWLGEVGQTRRSILTEIMSAHGVPMAWIDGQTTAGEVLDMAIHLGLLQQMDRIAAIAKRAASAAAEMELAHEIRRARLPVIAQGVRLNGQLQR